MTTQPPTSAAMRAAAKTDYCQCLMPFGSKTCHHCKKPVRATTPPPASDERCLCSCHNTEGSEYNCCLHCAPEPAPSSGDAAIDFWREGFRERTARVYELSNELNTVAEATRTAIVGAVRKEAHRRVATESSAQHLTRLLVANELQAIPLDELMKGDSSK